MSHAILGRKWLSLLAVVVLLAAPAVFVGGSNINQGEGYQITGSWVSATHYGAPGSVPALLTVHKDRTFSVSDGLMFLGLGGGKFSPLHGVWEHTGPKSFGGTALFMVYAPTGMLVAFGRARTALNFVDDPDHIEGLMYLEIGPPCTSPPFGCSDPLSPTATWTPISSMPPSGFPLSATRIHRVEMPD